ncbi:hypothetical protein EW145_g7484 [Phellinidium pouzarii]|uniref:Fe2OG dioxygenase domain-containing protein n=1 Tax=Phellinidium pouzarii TaxID=167371 RepID=A0A4V3XAH0_9AGAM|nr:hypothetical protein EW145_g7484 [Phellinidium pouzarii]
MPGIAHPPFPNDIPTHPLLVVDYALIKAGDVQEIEKLWKAATELGFWYYKAAGRNATDEYGSQDTVEFLNVSKDDALAYPEVIHRTYPSTVRARMESTIKPFVRKSLEVNNTVLSVFEKKLGLPAGVLLKYHALEEPSGSEARCIKNPPKRSVITAAQAAQEKERVALGAHTDFGSLSFLHNRLGGLQVLPPGSDDWQYVRPLPGHAICNVGDALTLFSGGILRSNLHRVVPPPGAQSAYARWSLVFFTRPGDNIHLHALAEESKAVKEVVERMTVEERKRFEPNATAKEWFARRVKNQRINNRTGPETWRASRGMEHKPEVI